MNDRSDNVEPASTPGQAGGLACVWCAADYLTVKVAHQPVGRSETGSQVFACVGACAQHVEAFRIFEREHGYTWPQFRQMFDRMRQTGA